MTRASRIPASPRRSLFRASALSRFAVASALAGLLWGGILWALR